MAPPQCQAVADWLSASHRPGSSAFVGGYAQPERVDCVVDRVGTIAEARATHCVSAAPQASQNVEGRLSRNRWRVCRPVRRHRHRTAASTSLTLQCSAAPGWSVGAMQAGRLAESRCAHHDVRIVSSAALIASLRRLQVIAGFREMLTTGPTSTSAAGYVSRRRTWDRPSAETGPKRALAVPAFLFHLQRRDDPPSGHSADSRRRTNPVKPLMCS